MLTMAAVADAVCAALHEQWPERNIHRNVCPADFDRPALLVGMSIQGRRVMNRALYEETGTVTVTCFSVMDANGTADASVLAEEAEALRTHFSAGYLSVAGRAVRLSLKETTCEADRCRTVFNCAFVETSDTEDHLPLMKEIHSRADLNFD